tara:strand:+ start:36711 stop:37829 length:1119 start_codon:yes stop_codon:yes gene_type:complete
MKTKIITIAFALIGLNAYAQITVADTDISSVGDIVYQAYDSIPAAAINIGSPGLSQIWDFSSLQVSSTNTISFISPIGTIYESQYPNTNLCLNDNGSLSYYNKNSSGLFIHGLGDTVFHSPALFYPLPLTYSLAASDGPVVIIDNVITGALLSMAIPATVVASLTNGVANRADTAIIKITNTSDFLVDASGVMTTPLGTFDVLRLKTIKYTNSELDVYCSDTLSGLGTWVTNIPFSTIPLLANFSNNEIEYKYQWITNDAAVAFLLAEIIVDDSDNIINGVSFQTSMPASSMQHAEEDWFQVFPNPTSKYITINTDFINCSYTLLNAKGKRLLSNELNRSTKIDMSLFASGTYFLQLYTEEGSVIVKKVVIK